MIEVGTVLQNRYRIEQPIGQGGMGKVYVASDERFKSTVAIKETVFEDKNLRKAFEREARLLNSLKHLALPRVSDHFIEGDGQFLVMEYIVGEDLAEKMERNGKAFSLDDVLNWSNQLCDALEYLHKQDIIHRDIKPQNLKLTPHGQIVLLDFGLAKGNATDSNNQTFAKSIFGYSRSYASLEQIQGTGTEPRSDLYSLAATIYHLLTGIPPVDALTRAMNVLNGKPDPLIPANLVNNNVPREVSEILQRSMALNASERPESAILMKRMLQESDKTIDETASELFAANAFTADLLTQDTKIKSATTNVPLSTLSELDTSIAGEKQTYKTKLVNADEDSKITKIRPLAEQTQSPKSFRKASAAVAGGLLLVGGIGAAILFRPAQSPANSNTGTTPAEAQSTLVVTTTNTQSSTNTTSTNEQKDVTPETTAKSPEKQANSKSTTVTAAKNNSKESRNQTESAQAETNPKSPTPPQSPKVVIGDDRIEIENMIIDENMAKKKRGARNAPTYVPYPNINPAIPGLGNFKIFTPEQIREIERAKDMKARTMVKPPTPKATP